MTKWIICLGLLLGYGVAEAHQPNLSSTLLVEQEDNKWVLKVGAALTAFEYEIESHFGESSYTTPEEFQKLVIQYTQENISILFNKENQAILRGGIVKLGHETSVIFEVVGTPESIQSLKVKNSSFSNISRNQSALIVLKDGYAKEQFVLNDSNMHTADLKLKNAKIVLVKPSEENSNDFILIFAIGCLVLAILYFGFENRQTKQLAPIPIRA